MGGLSASSPSPSPGSQSSEVEMDHIEKKSAPVGNEKPSDASINEKTVSTTDTQTRTTPSAAGQGDSTPDPYAHLQDHEAAILKRQVGTLEGKYSFWHIYRYATRVDLLIIAVAGVCSCASGAAMPVMTVIFGGLQGVFQDYLVYRTITLNEFKDEMARFVLYFVYLAIGTFFATYISTVGFMYTGEHITTNLRQQYLKSCLRQNIAFFDKVGAGEVAVKITSDADQIQDGISEKVGLLLACLATLITGYLIGFIISWKLTLIMSSVFVFLFLNTAVWTILMFRYAKPGTLVAVKASTLTQEIFTGVRVAIAFGSQKDVVKQYDGHLKATQGYGFKVKVAIGMMLAVSMGAMHLTYGLGFWQGSTFLASGELSLERMITALMSVMIGSFNVGSIGPYLQSFTTAISTAARLMMVIDRKTATDATDPDHGERPAEVHGQLKMENIKHIYPSRPEVTVLDGVSLDFAAGKVTALVGASGSGKSTIVGIIERFYDPVQGSVFLDGRDISTLNVGWLRRQIGVVGQEPVLFAGSILENIRHGLIGLAGEHLDEAAQRDLIVAAAKDANAHDFISQLAQGYETEVGQRGLLLSGGQKQRIAIARAIVSNPKILLLDEATSALDTKSEGVVQAALDQASVGRTTITIAHRLSTIRNAHMIIVMSRGKVVEQGTHEQLLEAKGAYYVLSNTQKVNHSDEPADIDDESKDQLAHELCTARNTDKFPHPPSESPSSAPITASATAAAPGNGQNEAEEPDYGVWTITKFVFSFGKQETLLMIIGFLFCIICGLATPVQSVFFAKQLMTLSHIGVPGRDTGEVQRDSNFWSLMFLMLGLVTLLANAVQSSAFAFASQAFIRRLTSETLAQLLRQDVSFFDQAKNSAGALTANLSLETMQTSNMSGGNLGNLLVSLSIVVGGISLSLAIGWKLALVCLSVVPVLVLCSFLRFYVIQQYTGRASRLYVDSAAFAAEHIAAMRTVASLSLEGYVADKYKNMAGDQRIASLKSVSKSAALYAASQSALFLCLGLGFWYGSTLMATFEYDIFQFFVCLMSVIFGSQSAGSMLTFIPDLVKARHAAARLKGLFDTKPSIDTWDETKGLQLEAARGRLEFRNVHFTYPTRPDRSVLRGLNLVVEPGQHIALVGASGCGKSTAIALIERFFDPSSGYIMLDDVDIADIQVNNYRSHIALVSQEPNLFQGTIRDNILFGRRGEEQISDQAMEQACRDANIYDFIVSLPDGFGTDIGSAGVLLSGGQKQRIAIARALVRQPKILLLDEATSALDSESESVVQAALDRAAKGRTTVTIAHRLATVRNADRILVIDQGCVFESGTHKELMEINGLYAELVKLQSLDSEQSPGTGHSTQ